MELKIGNAQLIQDTKDSTIVNYKLPQEKLCSILEKVPAIIQQVLINHSNKSSVTSHLNENQDQSMHNEAAGDVDYQSTPTFAAGASSLAPCSPDFGHN